MHSHDERLNRYSRRVFYDADDAAYMAVSPEFPSLSAFGPTREEALTELDAAIEGTLATLARRGWPIPNPEPPPAPGDVPSGRFVVRIPRTLHATLVAHAREEGVSLNQYVSYLLATGTGHDTAFEPAASQAPEPAAPASPRASARPSTKPARTA